MINYEEFGFIINEDGIFNYNTIVITDLILFNKYINYINKHWYKPNINKVYYLDKSELYELTTRLTILKRKLKLEKICPTKN
jgi:hypothetical protein